MTQNQSNHAMISRYMDGFLEEHFGERPSSITIILKPPFLLFYLEDFLLPGEKIFAARKEWNRILETRDLIMKSLKPDLVAGLQEQTDQKISDFYTDWNLENRSGWFLAVFEHPEEPEEWPWPEGVDQEALREIVTLNSIRTQKKPDNVYYYWLNSKVLLVEKVGILVDVEKQLIQNGIREELRLAKRPMEQRIVTLFNLDSLMNGKLNDFFVDWNFQEDRSFMALMLK